MKKMWFSSNISPPNIFAGFVLKARGLAERETRPFIVYTFKHSGQVFYCAEHKWFFWRLSCIPRAQRKTFCPGSSCCLSARSHCSRSLASKTAHMDAPGLFWTKSACLVHPTDSRIRLTQLVLCLVNRTLKNAVPPKETCGDGSSQQGSIAKPVSTVTSFTASSPC